MGYESRIGAWIGEANKRSSQAERGKGVYLGGVMGYDSWVGPWIDEANECCSQATKETRHAVQIMHTTGVAQSNAIFQYR